jgi:hypothetical protein
MPAIKFDDVQGLEPIPAGIYLATITKATEGVSKAGNEKIDCQWTVEAEDDPKLNGRILFDTLVFTEKALFRVKQVMEASGAFEDDFDGEVEAADFLGITAMLVVDIEESTQVDDATGEPYPPRNRVKRVKKA